jgi:hypothetical protein
MSSFLTMYGCFVGWIMAPSACAPLWLVDDTEPSSAALG